MDAIVNHIETFRGLSIVLAVVALGAGGMFGFDALTARRQRATVSQTRTPDHTRIVHPDNPWAGMNESGPKI